jgi:hypothetical protein
MCLNFKNWTTFIISFHAFNLSSKPLKLKLQLLRSTHFMAFFVDFNNGLVVKSFNYAWQLNNLMERAEKKIFFEQTTYSILTKFLFQPVNH